MNLEHEISRILPRSPARPLIWSAVGRFAIEPPERFYATQIWHMERGINRPPGLSPSRISTELSRLAWMDMVERLPDDPSLRVVYYVRTNPEAWDLALEAINSLQPTETVH